MARGSNRNSWRALKDRGDLQERHVQMAIDLEMSAETIVREHASAGDRGDLLLLEWIEDRFFTKHGHYSPESQSSPENQAEHPAENSLLIDHGQAISRMCSEMGIREDDDEALELANELIGNRKRDNPVSDGEIHETDQRMLRHQTGFRNAARAVAGHFAAMPEVQQVRIFGSVALPLWKEVPHHPRLRHRNIRVYHECANIDLAVRVTSPVAADRMCKACSRVVADLTEQEIYLNIAHHTFSIHLIDDATDRYLGMACHFNQCPKHKRECQVPGCGAAPFVRILPDFKLKPHRLNSSNSQVLFQRHG